ncbi:protein ENHANCED DOWNY MILDEW 2-like isoform X1 [Senna tora]|uniref:Protein ENHANCED DOWNY MILDEW 2-like isoform X1 n=1 Tax=Senna tora TaxID=362788 RepID=A0A834U2L9_9FABA|nr:protein ENHANCED DOWNY MILDEW 2-like isoform X1 [Senna tora]
MASSDDEDEFHPQSVSNYHFEDDKDAPVPISALPIQWSESENLEGKKEKVYLHGFADNGLQKVFMQVIAWKFDISNVKPEISVLSKNRRWIKLQKPRKSFEDTIRTILITVHFLHYVEKNPEASAKSAWDYLSKVLSCYEVRPSQSDLLNHLPLIDEAIKRNAILAKSKLLLTVLEKQQNTKVSDEDADNLARPSFIVDNFDDDTIDEAAEESDDDDDQFDSVCAICDNGGTLLCCDGKCMRSFHPTKEDGADSMCDSLGLTQKEVDAIQNFYCKNCEYNQHQCFVCGKLGSSDKFLGAEVFRCASATCGRFYHPHCVAKLLHLEDEHAAKELEKNIADGETFTCPIHYCCICKQIENKKEKELQFAVCRRCSKSYHRKCLPSEIVFEGNEEEGIIIRAWEDLLPNNRILIYCLEHEIDDELGTPMRDHVRFPKVKHNVREINSSLQEEAKPSTQERVVSKNINRKKINPKVSKMIGKSSSGKLGVKKNSEKIISGSNISKKRKAKETPARRLNENKKSKVIEKIDGEEGQPSLGEKLYAFMTKDSDKTDRGKHDDNVANKTFPVKPTKVEPSSTLPQLDADSERRLLALYKEARSSITLEDVLEKHKLASTHTQSLRNIVEKTITAGKLEGSVDAVRTALRKLEDGRSIEDSEAVCDPDVLSQIFKWKDKLKVYLAPALNGNRYTSYGRHFTQVEKLEGIVDKLHCYVKNGDTIVDFCCGANDFSILMKKKLEETGKKCFYKNYDLLPTKIMGLNPPFGLKAVLANKFIDKALEFQPKLIVLIVPPETQRLDKKRTPYDLVWEDEKFLSGKSFYLPGSVDINDRQMEQWNVRPPLLYLWSRRDWTDKHKAIAKDHGHMPSQHEVLPRRKSFNAEVSPADPTMDDGNHDDDLMLGHDLSKTEDNPEGGQAPMNEDQMETLFFGNNDQENLVEQEQDPSLNKSDITSWKKKNSEENDGRGRDVVSPANNTYDGVEKHSQTKAFDGRSSMEGQHSHPKAFDGRSSMESQHSLPKAFDGRSPMEGFPSKPVISPPHVGVGDNAYRYYEPTTCSPTEFAATYGGTQNWSTAPPSDYGARNFEEQHNSFLGDTTGSFGYRPHIREEDNYWKESDIRQQIRIYGIQEPEYMRSGYVTGDDPTYGQMRNTYGQLGSVPESSYMNTPAMHRYAPRLDESNNARMRNFGSEPPIAGRNDNLERSVPPQSRYGSGPVGFAPGPHHLHSRHSSAGWLNE